MLPLLTPALEALAKLLEKIVDLEKSKLKDKETLFNEIAKPLYNELEPVASQYMETFRKTKKLVLSNSSQMVDEAIVLIGKDRESMHMARVKISTMIRIIEEKINDQNTIDFAKEVENFFYGASGGYKLTLLSMLMNYLQHIKSRNDITDNVKEKILDYIDDTLPKLEQAWATATESYEKLKIQSVAPNRFIRKSHSTKK